MILRERKLKGVVEISLEPHVDFRGFLVRTYDCDILKNWGIEQEWVQESLSHTSKASTVRGLHIQLAPYKEAKLISVVRGKMRWVVVDLRKDSHTFGHWDSVILSADRFNSLFVENGFAHGCISLSDGCDLVIKADQKFVENSGTGIVWNDSALGIDWGIGDIHPIMSERDKNHPTFESFLKNYGSL